jgi:hypothetical protein
MSLPGYDAWKTDPPLEWWGEEEPEPKEDQEDVVGELEPVDEGWWDSVLSDERLGSGRSERLE